MNRKTTTFLLIITLLSGFINCSSIKNDLYKSGDKNKVIKNAILDFSNSCSIYKKDSVFMISYNKNLVKMVLKKVDNKNQEWVESETNFNISTVNISPNYNKLFVDNKENLPSMCIEKNGKLFYWWEENQSTSEDVINKLKKYNIATNDMISALDSGVDDSQKSAHYYFCKSDLSNYNRIITNKALGYYESPSMDCK